MKNSFRFLTFLFFLACIISIALLTGCPATEQVENNTDTLVKMKGDCTDIPTRMPDQTIKPKETLGGSDAKPIDQKLPSIQKPQSQRKVRIKR
jgi:hypothetical protein